MDGIIMFIAASGMVALVVLIVMFLVVVGHLVNVFCAKQDRKVRELRSDINVAHKD